MDSKCYTIRTIELCELPMLARLFEYNDLAEMIEENTRAITNSSRDIFVLFLDGELIGELHTDYESEDPLEAVKGKRAYLSAYRIRQEDQNKGYGKFLLRCVLDRLTEKGYTEFTIGVEDDNAVAKHIYQSFGFSEKIARKSDTYQGDSFEYDLLLKRNVPILTDEDGNLFLSLEQCSEDSVTEGFQPLTHCLAIVTLDNRPLFGFNQWRNRYEIFGGCIENDETPRECIERECYEELGISSIEFTFIGIMKFLMQPDYFSDRVRIEYGALYSVSLYGRSLKELSAQINDRQEITKLAFYDEIKDQFPIAAIDEKLLDYDKKE